MANDYPEGPSGRVALVTGAARGIGAAAVRALAWAGYFVIAVDDCGRRRYAPSGHSVLPATRADLDAVVLACPGRVSGVVADVADAAALERLCTDLVAERGRLDVVVAAAAVIDGGAPLWECPPQLVRELLEVDALGVWNTAAASVPHLLASAERERTRLVVVTSAAADRGLYHLAGYTMAKHAALGVVRGLAADLEGTGVVVVAVSPGSTNTRMLAATAEIYGGTTDELVGHQSLRRVIDPTEIAEAILFVCSPAGASLTGSVVAAEGGFHQ